MFGIEDPQVWLAYLACVSGAVFCVLYGIVNWNKGDNPVHVEDKKWVGEEKTAEDQF